MSSPHPKIDPYAAPYWIRLDDHKEKPVVVYPENAPDTVHRRFETVEEASEYIDALERDARADAEDVRESESGGDDTEGVP